MVDMAVFMFLSLFFFLSFYFRKLKNVEFIKDDFHVVTSVVIKNFIKIESHLEMEFNLDYESG